MRHKTVHKTKRWPTRAPPALLFCTSIALWVGQRICVCQLASTLAESRHFHPALAAPHKRSWSQQNAQSFLDSRKVHGESDVITTLGEYFLSTHVV